MSAYSQPFEEEKALREAVDRSERIVRDYIGRLETEVSYWEKVVRDVSGADKVWVERVSGGGFVIRFDPAECDA